MNLIIDSIIKIGVIIVLIIGASTKQEYSYYTFLRWLVMVSAIYFSYKAFSSKQIGLLILFLSLAILFNPFQKFWFQKSTWALIDYIVSFILITIIAYDILITRRQHENK